MGVGLWEIIIILLVALLVINPKDLPKIAYYIGAFIAKCSKFFQNLKNQYIDSITKIDK